MRKVALLGVVGAVATLVACATSPDESAASSAADTTNATSTTTGSRTTGSRTGTGRATNGVVTVSTDDAGAAPTGPSCYANQGTCEPTNPTSCGKGETCDINGQTQQFECFPPPNTALLGDACNNGAGPFCAHGLACSAGICKAYCCDDSQCASGTTCQQTGTDGFIVISVCQ